LNKHKKWNAGQGNTFPNPNIPVSDVTVVISPKTAKTNVNSNSQFSAQVSNSADVSATFSVDNGRITQSGLFTAPTTAGSSIVTVTSKADTSKFDTAVVSYT
jgi:hypothetical protein